MQTKPTNWDTYLAALHEVDFKIVVDGTTYLKSEIVSIKITGNLYTELGIGNCSAKTAEVEFYPTSSPARQSSVQVFVRIKSGNNYTDYIPKGTFFISKRETNYAKGTLKLTCYDAMLKAEQTYIDEQVGTLFPRSAASVLSDIASRIGVTLDSRNVISSDFQVEYPNDLTMREELSLIGIANGGNWTITEDNKLYLCPLKSSATPIQIGRSCNAINVGIQSQAISKVEILNGNGDVVGEAGTTTGKTITVYHSAGDNSMATHILSLITGYTHQGYSASRAIIDPAYQLGDRVSLGSTNEVVGVITAESVTFSALYSSNLSSPDAEEIEDEYPYISETRRAIERSVKIGLPYYGTKITRENGLVVEKIQNNTVAATARFNADELSFYVGSTKVLYYDPVRGTFVFDGALGSDAVFTDSLYAERGDVAELTVDELSTSRQVKEYLLDTYYRATPSYKDDNYIHAEGMSIRWVTGTVSIVNGVAQTQHLVNRNGSAMYWRKQIASVSSDGYPFDADGNQVYSTVDVTDYPVTVYVYNNSVKMAGAFALDQVSGYYVPQMDFGAGDGFGGSVATIRKGADGLLLKYITANANKTLAMSMNNDGYVDIDTMRRPTNFNFSTIGSGTFTETVDGGATVTYSVTKDSSGRITSITSGGGSSAHTTTITW